MSAKSRHPLPVRITAVGFIFSILFGNLWLVYLVTSAAMPNWIGYGFYLGVVLALGGGAGTFVRFLRLRVFGQANEDDYDAEEEQ